MYLVFVLSISFAFSWADIDATTMDQLVDAMNQRMHLMIDVAAYKEKRNLPVLDAAREAEVIEESKKEAETLGLDPSSIIQFVQAQMNVGKAIQYRLLADWLSEPELKPSTEKSIEEVRNEITALDKTILGLISQQVHAENGFGPKQIAQLTKGWQSPNIKDADRNNLAKSLICIRILS